MNSPRDYREWKTMSKKGKMEKRLAKDHDHLGFRMRIYTAILTLVQFLVHGGRFCFQSDFSQFWFDLLLQPNPRAHDQCFPNWGASWFSFGSPLVWGVRWCSNCGMEKRTGWVARTVASLAFSAGVTVLPWLWSSASHLIQTDASSVLQVSQQPSLTLIFLYSAKEETILLH